MKNILFALLVATSICGCTKSEKSATTEISMQSLAGNYKITSATVNGIDILSVYLPPCQADDIYTLNADGTYTIADAGAACTPSSATSGTWVLSGSQIKIGTQIFTLVSFDGAKITATSSVTQAGTTVTVTVVFTKQ